MNTLTSSPILFGSEDSVDRDALYLVSELPDFEACREYCRSIAVGERRENRNLAVVQDGVVVDCFKGLPDELNNAVFSTYSLHPQEMANPIVQRVRRMVPLKAVRAVRIILSMLSRTTERSQIKAALQSYNQEQRVETLRQIDFADAALDTESLKSIAFQLGQILALIDGIECYTKSEIMGLFPELAPFLRREPEADASVLNRLTAMLHKAVEDVYIRQKGVLNLFCYKNSVVIEGWNQYARQTRGMVLDMHKERCVYYPGDKFWRIGEVEETKPEHLSDLTDVEIVEKVDGSMVGCFRHGETFEFICKGNFDVEQSLRAKTIAERFPAFSGLSPLDFDRYWHVFEVIYPENRFPTGLCVTDHGDEEKLVLIAMRDRRTNEALPYSQVINEAQRVGLPHPRKFDGTFEDLQREVQSVSPQFPDQEGYVVRTKEGMLLKVKYPKYLEIHKWNNRMGQGRNRFLKNYVLLSETEQRELLAMFPAVFREYAEKEIAQFEAIQATLAQFVKQFVATYAVELGNEFPQYAVAHAPKELLASIMRHWKNQPFDSLLSKPAVNVFYGKVVVPAFSNEKEKGDQ
jgi:hypothetical protein